MIWRLRVLGIPVPAGRPRAFRMGDKVRMHDPETSRDWKRTIIHEAASSRPRIFTGPVRLVVSFYLPKPKSAPKRVTQHTSRPDIDNLVKSVKDALRGIVFMDDSQVVWLQADKLFASGVEPPGVQIMVQDMPGEGLGDRARDRRTVPGQAEAGRGVGEGDRVAEGAAEGSEGAR